MADSSAWIQKNKAIWARVYDEVIAPDLEEVWKKREEKHEKELKQKDENQQILFNHLNDEILKTAHLTKENEQLKEQLEAREKAIQPQSDHETATLSAPVVTEEEHCNLAQKYDELSRKYRDVSQKVKYLERKNATVTQKNKDMKESVRAWQEYVDRKLGEQKPKNEVSAEAERPRFSAAHLLQDDRPHIPSSPGSVATAITSRSLADLQRSSPVPMVPLPQSVLRNSNPKSPGTTAGEDRNSTATVTPKGPVRMENIELPQPKVNSESTRYCPSHMQRVISDNESHHVTPGNLTSSQTTVDELAEQSNRHEQAMIAEDDDDFPQFVSERSLKRKRGQPSKSRFEIYADRSSDGTPLKPYGVKEEPSSSPPVSAYKFSRNETMDLDDPAPNGLTTPRHPRTRHLFRTGTNETLRQQRSSSAPHTQNVKVENTEAGFSPPHDVTHVCVESSRPQAVAMAEVRACSEPTEPTQTGANVLMPLDLNIVSSASEESPNKRIRKAAIHQRAKYGFLTESGEALPPMDDSELRMPPHLAREQMNRKLQALKKSPRTPAKATPKLRSTKIKAEPVSPPSASSSRTGHVPTGELGSRNQTSKSRSKPRKDVVTPTDRPIWTMKAPEPRSSARKNRISPSKDQTPLRDRPIENLSAQDFKPNPAYNQGYSYAFSETVRKRGDRMCLPGCTNPQCCGSTFRTFAEAQAPLSSSQEEAILEDYLGNAYNNMQLTQMSREERQELVLQARTKKMAKESGKHREAYERRRTPPGFWRVDFPTTQERQEDRERAKEQEKQVVQERWLEAHRRGGRWIFRDE